MNTKRVLKIGLVSGIIAMAMLLSLYTSAYAVLFLEDTIREGQTKPEYVPGEVLVKFKEEAGLQTVLQKVNITAQSIERVYSIKPIIAKFKKDAILEKDSNGWYWYRGKNYKEITDVADEEFFQEAYAQMSPEKKALYRTYKITLPKGASVEEAVIRLQDDPTVEYAEPNYIAKVMAAPNDPYYGSRGSWGQDYDDFW